MKHTVNEIDQALREKLRMNDTQFAWYLDHREEVIDKLKSYKKAKHDIIEDFTEDLKKSKKRNSAQLLICNVYLHYENNDFSELENVEIAELAGVSPAYVGQCINSTLTQLRKDPLFKRDGEFSNAFEKENLRWLN